MELAQAVYHPYFMDQVTTVLKCVSYYTSQLLVDRSRHDFQAAMKIKKGDARLKAMAKICGSIRTCPTTNNVQPEYKKEEKTFLIHAKFDVKDDGPPPEDGKITADRAYEILRQISDEDAVALGFDPKRTRPEWMILKVFPVPPPTVRPGVVMDMSGMESHDDLTNTLVEILKRNNALRVADQSGAGSHVKEEIHMAMSNNIWGYINNAKPSISTVMNKSDRPIKSITERLKGKHGRVRGNLMGKRVDFSARSVITGDANIGIDELGVPYSVARNMTFPEKVTPLNQAQLQQYVSNGPNPSPGVTGAKFVITRDGQERFTKHANVRERTLEIGDTVGRQLMTGDVVLFNRQPSLHKVSMEGAPEAVREGECRSCG